MMSSPSLFVQRLKSICTTDSSQCTYRHESQIATKVLGQEFPNWLCGRGDLFFWFSPDFSRKTVALRTWRPFFWSSLGFSRKVIRLSASGWSPSRNGRVTKVESESFLATTRVKSFFVATRVTDSSFINTADYFTISGKSV